MKIIIQSEFNEYIIFNGNNVESLDVKKEDYFFLIKIKFENCQESNLKLYEFLEKQITFNMIIKVYPTENTNHIFYNLNIKSIEYDLKEFKFILYIDNKHKL